VSRSNLADALGPPAYVILGMVHLGAQSGYEIKRMVELSTRFFWTISQAQIYPSLQRLGRAGLVTGRADPQAGGPGACSRPPPRDGQRSQNG
jgi:DNA-binding PadR family transcriptional regulator